MIFTVTLNPGLDRTIEVDQIRFDCVLRANKTQLDWGGKGLNVSRALHELGGESIALGFLGGDTGKILERGLKDAGIVTDFTWIDGETRTNVVIQEAVTGRHIKVNEPGPKIGRKSQEKLVNKVTQMAGEDDWWVFCGSLPPGVPQDIYVRLIRSVGQKGGKAVLDTAGIALKLGYLAAPYLIKPNRLEAEEVVGFQIQTERDMQGATKRLMEPGAQLIAISLGKDGLWLANRQESLHVRPPQLEAVGAAVGAGDALLAGLIWSLSRGDDLEKAGRWAVATGTAAAMQPGVEMARREEVERILLEVKYMRGE